MAGQIMTWSPSGLQNLMSNDNTNMMPLTCKKNMRRETTNLFAYRVIDTPHKYT